MFRGVFDTWDAAAASAPPTRPLGYDNPDSAALYLRHLSVEDWDYPALFWIADSVAKGLRHFADIGGSVGIKYYAFGKFVKFPGELRWRVIDVPAVVARGREFALQRGAPPPGDWSHRRHRRRGRRLRLGLAAIHCPRRCPKSCFRSCAACAASSSTPRRFSTSTPSSSRSTASAPRSAPNTAVHGSDRLRRTRELGYRMRDTWRNIGKPMHIPFHPDESLREYTGFCFDAVENCPGSGSNSLHASVVL